MQPRTPLTRVIATNIKEYFPPLLRLLFTLVREKKDGDRITLGARRPRLRASCCAAHRGRRRARAPLTPDDPAVLLMSGGTTGTPKGVLGTHGAYVMAGLQIQAWNAVGPRATATASILLPLPLFHVYANVGVQALALITRQPDGARARTRATSPICSRPISRVKPAFFNGVPTLYIALLNHPDVQRGKVDFKSIKICFSGAAPLHGRHEAALRSADRRPDRRGLLADRSDDGAVRQPGEGTEQARLGRHAAARRARRASSTATKARARCRPARSARSALPRRS